MLTQRYIVHIVWEGQITKGERMDHNKRYIRYYDCKISASVKIGKTATGVKPVPLLTVLEQIKALITSGENIAFTGLGDTQTWNLQGIEIDPTRKLATILVNRSDQMAADQAISDPNSTQYFAVASKAGTQGNAYSSHIVFNYGKSSDHGYLVLIEEAVGINAKDLERLLFRAVVAANKAGFAAFNYPHPDSTNKILKGRYKFELTGHPSQKFIDELNGGILQNIELITKNNAGNKKFDAYSQTEYHSQIIKLKLISSKTTSVIDLVKSVCKHADELKMEKVRIKFTDPSDFSHTVNFASSDATVIDEDKYVKKEVIQNFGSRLDTAFQNIQAEIRDKMYYLLR